MQRQRLIHELLETADDFERKSLLTANPALLDLEFAAELKNTYYDSWTTEPAKTRRAAAALRLLADLIPNEKVRAFADWVAGIAKLTDGQAFEAIVLLDRAAEILQKLDSAHEAAQTQVGKLYALALLGEYDCAIEIGESALEIFVRHGDELSAAKIEKNIGNIHYRRDHYQAAAKFYEAAQDRFRSLDNQPQLAMVENCLAVVAALQNDFRRAEQFYAAALRRAEAVRMPVTEAEIAASLGNLALFRGRYAEALKFLEKSRRTYARLEMPHQTAIADLEVADVYLELNLISQAVEIYQRAAAEFADFKMRVEEARTRAQLGKALAQTVQTDRAFRELEQAERLYALENNRVGAASVKLVRANLHLRAAEFETARELCAAATAIFLASNSRRSLLLAELLSGEIERRSQNLDCALTILRGTSEAARDQDQPQIRWATETALGLTQLARNNAAAAETHFTQAVEIIENLREPLAADVFRVNFFADKLQPYHELAKICAQKSVQNAVQQSDNLSQAFGWIERARSQALLDLISRKSGDETRGDWRQASETAFAENENQAALDNLREELNWFESRLMRPTISEKAVSETELETWRSEAKTREHAINRLLLQTEINQPTAATLQTEFDLAKLQRSLGANRILIEFAEFGAELTAFAVTSSEIRLVRNLGEISRVTELLKALHFQFSTFRYGAANLEKHLPQLKRRTLKLLQNLFDLLLLPLAEIIGDKHLIVVPTGNLHHVPFHALHDGAQFTIDKREVSYAPSARVLQNLLEQSATTAESALIVGFADEFAAQIESEVVGLSQLFANHKVLNGAAATFAQLEEILRRESFDVVHLACHGRFHRENPMFSGLHFADGWANVRDAARLRLDNALVVLSACETGLSDVAAGDELLGIIRGLLIANANSLVLSLWTVNDHATTRLMQNFYQHLRAGQNAAAALRKAQIRFIKEDAHPYFWAPFSFTGAW